MMYRNTSDVKLELTSFVDHGTTLAMTPKKPPKSKVVRVRVTQEQWERWWTCARDAGIPMSQWMSLRIEGKAIRQFTPAPAPLEQDEAA